MNPPTDQGFQSSGCPFCQVLYPDLATCPRCKGQAGLEAARMLDGKSIELEVMRNVTAYDGSRQQLDALLRTLFVYHPAATAAMVEDGRITLEQLRRDDESLSR